MQTVFASRMQATSTVPLWQLYHKQECCLDPTTSFEFERDLLVRRHTFLPDSPAHCYDAGLLGVRQMSARSLQQGVTCKRVPAEHAGLGRRPEGGAGGCAEALPRRAASPGQGARHHQRCHGRCSRARQGRPEEGIPLTLPSDLSAEQQLLSAATCGA